MQGEILTGNFPVLKSTGPIEARIYPIYGTYPEHFPVLKSTGPIEADLFGQCVTAVSTFRC